MNIEASTTCCSAARAQAEPQRLLFVFAGAELPADASAAQRASFEAGEGGELAPLMCVDKAAAELGRLRRTDAPRRRKPARPGPSSSRAALSGQRRPAAQRRATPTPRCSTWSTAIKSGRLDGMLPFNRAGEPVQLA